jgi:hypothetical protein
MLGLEWKTEEGVTELPSVAALYFLEDKKALT